MKMRNMIWFGAMAVMAGCSGQVAGPVNEDKDPTLFAIAGGCPYPMYGCGVSNGTGVYHQEGGFAGMSANKLMITHFINNGSSVSFQGRYQRLTSPYYWYFLSSPGMVRSATYFGVDYPVVSITESGTYPTITMLYSGRTFTVSGAALSYVKLNLYVYIREIDHNYTWQLSFGDMQSEAAGAGQYPNTIYKYDLQYRDVGANGPWTEYCRDANGNPDPVDLQGGIDVAPTSGTVTNTSNVVTLSCRLGAIATVYSWGYDYHNDPWHYAAGIHMKRASYCGDYHYFTVAGTQMIPSDDTVRQVRLDTTPIEAFWTPTGASCFNQSRRPDLAAFGVTPFDSPTYNKSCNGQQLPPCPSYWSQFDADGNPYTFLADGIVAGQ